jgi:hypothetical protein
MKRIIIVVEGQTEQEFVKQCIAPHLLNKYGIFSAVARLIGKPGHKGGDVRYSRLKKDIDIVLREPDVVVSMFVDFFKLANDFPSTDNCLKYGNAEHRIACLEQALAVEINSQLFIPYIQRHEFEALLFSSHKGFLKYLSTESCQELEEVSRQFDNPEDINSTQPPSYRLIDIVGRCDHFLYNKVLYGNIFALEIGMEVMLARCQRFAAWIDQMGKLASLG